MPRWMTCFPVLLALGLPTFAQPDTAARDEAVKKQKAAAVENLKLLKIAKPTLVETDSLLVYADLPEDRLKPIAEAAQKFDDKTRLWDGKLTVYALADRPTEYTRFVKLVEQRDGRLGTEEMRTHGLKPQPYVAVTVVPGSRAADAELRTEAMNAVGTVLADQKAGATLPLWLNAGIGRAVVLHTDGNAALLGAHKTKVRGLFNRVKVGTFKAGDLWAARQPKDFDTLSASMGEYLLYGADAETVAKFLGGFKATDDRRDPSVMTALAAAEWEEAAFDIAWKKWVMGLK